MKCSCSWSHCWEVWKLVCCLTSSMYYYTMVYQELWCKIKVHIFSHIPNQNFFCGHHWEGRPKDNTVTSWCSTHVPEACQKPKNILGLKTQPKNCSGVGFEEISTPEDNFSTPEYEILTEGCIFSSKNLK